MEVELHELIEGDKLVVKDDLPLDPNRTLLTGDAEELKVGKFGGKHLMFETAYLRRSPGFELNDLGYLQRAEVDPAGMQPYEAPQPAADDAWGQRREACKRRSPATRI